MTQQHGSIEGKQYDLAVIGTGWHGLIAAKVYRELHPDVNIVLLEAQASVGGTWAEDRIYPGLKSNNLLDTFEYPDFPMLPETYGVQPGEHIPGSVINKYLTSFAQEFGLYDKIVFNFKVDVLEPSTPSGWNIMSTSRPGTGPLRLSAKKVIVATGLTSRPNVPVYDGQDSFNAPYFHGRDFALHKDSIRTAKSVVIIGGAKSAYDIAYAYAEAGVTENIHMVIRPDGNGPVWISYPWVLGGKGRLETLLVTRFMTWFSPCIFGGIDGYGWMRSFLHGTAVGRFIVRQFWGSLEGEVIEKNGYKTGPEIKKLQPWNPAFWIGSGLSIHNYPQDFFDMVKTGRVKVSVANVERLSDHAVHLSDGQELKADVLVAATGWRKEPPLEIKGLPAGIGLAEELPERLRLSSEADAKVLAALPSLRQQPTSNKKPTTAEPFRLYRYIAPPTRVLERRDLAFAGLVSTVLTATTGTVQALWISAFFDGKLDIMAESSAEVTKEVLLHTQWNKWRHPVGYGPYFPDMAFDTLPYIDLLLKDLGLKINRKGSWFKDLSERYGPRDFAGIVDEWKEAHGE